MKTVTRPPDTEVVNEPVLWLYPVPFAGVWIVVMKPSVPDSSRRTYVDHVSWSSEVSVGVSLVLTRLSG